MDKTPKNTWAVKRSPEAIKKENKISKRIALFGCLPIFVMVLVIIVGSVAQEMNSPEKTNVVVELTPEQKRTKAIKNQFSVWDGSHLKLERFIKKSMNDPDSYEHVKTTYWDMQNYLVVKTVFRGNNAFGAKVMNSVKVKTDIFTGEILEVME